MATVLRIKDLIISGAQGKQLAHIPELNIERGTSYGIIGESGSGKSLTLLSIIGLLPNSVTASGMIAFSEAGKHENLLLTPYIYIRALRGKHIGIIFQEPMSALNPQRTCGWQLMESLSVHLKLDKKAGRQMCLDTLSEVGIEQPERVFDSYPHQISGGQRQRVMIAMATIHKPILVLADEPTTALDPVTANLVLEILNKRCKDLNASLILVSHDLNAVRNHCSHTTVMHHGKVLCSDMTSKVFASDNLHPYVQELLNAQPTGTRQKRDKLNPDLTVTALDKVYKSGSTKHQALSKLSFSLGPGESLAVIGYSGSGKTTLAKILTGLEKADNGELIFKGEKLPATPPTGVHMVFQDPYASLNTEQTNLQTLLEVLHSKGVTGTEALTRSIELFQSTGLAEELLQKYPHQLSGGQRQRLCIARSLAADPEILVLDEAVAALDPIIQKQVLDLLIRIQEKTGIRYVFITHNPEAAKYLCHRYIRLEKGVCTEAGAY